MEEDKGKCIASLQVFRYDIFLNNFYLRLRYLLEILLYNTHKRKVQHIFLPNDWEIKWNVYVRTVFPNRYGICNPHYNTHGTYVAQ